MARHWLAAVLAMLLVLTVGTMAPIRAAVPIAAPPAVAAPAQPPATGSFQLASVRILGIPVITVASPEVGGDKRAISATERARVIEGNLAWLYEPMLLCSKGEGLAEEFLELGFLHGRDRACNADHLGLGGAPDRIRVTVQGGTEGPLELVVLTPQRAEPWPLLTVTAEDARLNGVSREQLAQRWSRLLERRLIYARRALQPEALRRQWRNVLLAESLLAVLLVAAMGLSLQCRRITRRWLQKPPLLLARQPRMQVFVVHITQNLSRGGLLLAAVLAVLMAGALAFAMPGRLPLALDLLLQPGGLLLKLIGLWCVALAARLILNVLLGQWRSNIDVPAEWRARRNQRFRSLQRVLGRLVNLFVISGGGIWMLSDIPGVRELSSAAVVAGGALLGALALVFQGLLRDFVAGLVVIFDDRYAIGDTVEINGLTGDVVDVGLLSTELRCADQRSVVMQNSSFDQVVNHSKLRSGIDIRIPLSPCRHNLESTLAIVDRELTTFAADPKWASELLAAPVLRGVDQLDPTAITVSVMLMTTAGQQWALRRELLRQLVTCFEREGIPLASQEWNRREP